MVGQRHVVRPHVVLPLAKADHAAQDVAGMDADTHVDVDSGGVPDLSVGGGRGTRQRGRFTRAAWSFRSILTVRDAGVHC